MGESWAGGRTVRMCISRWQLFGEGTETALQCRNTFIYSANVSGGVILGYPFLKAFGLLVDPVHDHLVDALVATATHGEVTGGAPKKVCVNRFVGNPDVRTPGCPGFGACPVSAVRASFGVPSGPQNEAKCGPNDLWWGGMPA